MPAKRRSARQEAPAKKDKPSTPPASSRKSRASAAAASPASARAGTKRKASPSPAPSKASAAKKGRVANPSPSPTKKLPARGRSAATKSDEKQSKSTKSRSASTSKGDQKQSRVTRAVVEETESKKTSTAKGRSSSKQKAPTPQKKDTPKRSATPKQKAATPKQKATKQQKPTARSRSATPKSPQKAATTKQKSTPKQKASLKKTATAQKQKQSGSKQKTASKTKTSTKPETVKKSTPRRSRGAKADEEENDDKESKPEGTEESPAADEVEKDSKPASNEDGPDASTEEKVQIKDDKPEETVEKEDESEEEKEDESEEEKDESAEEEKVPEEETKEEKIKDKKEESTEEKEDIQEQAEEQDDEEEVMEADGKDDVAVEKVADQKEEEKEDEEIEQSEEVEAKPEEKNAMEVEDVSEKDSDEAEESAEAVKDETAVQEDENVEEDQAVTNETNIDAQATTETEEKESKAVEDQSENVTKEEDAMEQQAESEQIESDSKEECESAESEQVEADVLAPESTKEASVTENVEAIEVNSDESSKDGVDEEAAIILDESSSEDSRAEAAAGNTEEAAAGNIGGGDAQGIDQTDKTEQQQEVDDDDIQEIGFAPAPVIEVEDQAETINDVSTSGIEEAQDAIQVMDEENMVNSTVSNGGTGESGSPRKRKHDDTDEDDEVLPKKARLSIGEDQMENGSLSHENEVSKDYVVVEMGEVPPADSKEVKDSLPKEVDRQSSVGENPVYSRVFIPNSGFSSSGEGVKQFSIVSYNVLADCHLLRNDYSFTDSKYLQPEHRLTHLIKELEYLNGDVVCLQEVEPGFYTDTLLPKMQSLGYEGIFKKRTTEYYNEGEATFFKLSRFSLVDYTTPRLADLVEKELSGVSDSSLQAAVKQYMDLSDVVIVTKLKCNNTGSEVTIGNIHVVWGEMKVPDAQCVQIASAIKEIVMKAGVDNLPHLICGDFNSTPFSPGYLVAKDGYPTGDETVTKLQEITGLQLPEGQTAALVNSVWPAFQHTSSLKSAYNEVEGSEPQITSFNGVMRDTVDYIFYSASSLDNVGVLRTASKERVVETGGIPNKYFPSDHISLKAVLSFK